MDRLALEMKRLAEQLNGYAQEIEDHLKQNSRIPEPPRLTIVRAPIHDDEWAELAWIAQMPHEQRRALMLAGRVDIDRLRAGIVALCELIGDG